MHNNQRDLSKILDEVLKPIRAIYVASYIPMRCGIATFTKDLVTAINNQNPEALAEIIVSDDNLEEYAFPWEAKYKINKEDASGYVETASYINQSSADIVCIEHEFGIYGGNDGEYLLPMIDSINKPIVTCFHTILTEPKSQQKYIMRRIVDASSAVVAMSQDSRQLLIDVYGCKPDKAVLIHHGVPDFELTSSSKYKKELGIECKNMIMMSGLIGPGKGIEYVIKAMPKILNENPDLKFYVLGQTHPGVVRTSGEVYRESLIQLAKDLDISSQVVFVNKYLSLEELMVYYKAADIFLTPHLDPQQPTSGTLAYALGAGKVCISTPYVYAKEMLSKEVGILVPFKESEPIADAINSVLKDPILFEKYRTNAYSMGKTMQWPRIAAKYLSLFRVIIDAYNE